MQANKDETSQSRETAGADSKRRSLISRRQFCTAALKNGLEHYRENAITERLNEVYAGQPIDLDEALMRAQLATLPPESWDEPSSASSSVPVTQL